MASLPNPLLNLSRPNAALLDSFGFDPKHIFVLGSRLEKMVSSLDAGWTVAAEVQYRETRADLLRRMMFLGVMSRQEPERIADALDEAFPRSLADVHDAGWSPSAWRQVQNFVLTCMRLLGYDLGIVAPELQQPPNPLKPVVGRPRGRSWSRTDLLDAARAFIATDADPTLARFQAHAGISKRNWQRYTKDYCFTWSGLRQRVP